MRSVMTCLVARVEALATGGSGRELVSFVHSCVWLLAGAGVATGLFGLLCSWVDPGSLRYWDKITKNCGTIHTNSCRSASIC